MDADMIDAVDLAIERAVDEACGREMVYGENDCVLWCAAVLMPFLGYDPVESFRDRYADPVTAQSLMGPLGLAREIGRVGQLRGWRRKSSDDAALGDLGVIRTDFGPACALFWRMDMWVGPLSRGFATVPRKSARFIWRPLACLS